MNLKEVLEQQAPDEVMYLDYLTLDPQPDQIVLTAQSPVFHAWMKSMANDKIMSSDKWGGSYYKINVQNIKGMTQTPLGADLNNIGGVLSQPGPNGTFINLSWLRHTELDKGISLGFPAVSNWVDIEDYMNVAAEALKILYLQNIRKSVLTLRLGEKFDG